MSGRVTRALQGNWLLAAFTALVVLLALLYFVFAAPLSPEGRYRLPLSGSSAEHVLFHDGKVHVQIVGSTNRCVGVYCNSNHQWIFQSSINNTRRILVPGFLGMGTLDPETKMPDEYLPRSGTYWLLVGKGWTRDAIDQLQDWLSP